MRKGLAGDRNGGLAMAKIAGKVEDSDSEFFSSNIS
jgi:hypothetical protein